MKRTVQIFETVALSFKSLLPQRLPLSYVEDCLSVPVPQMLVDSLSRASGRKVQRRKVDVQLVVFLRSVDNKGK